LVCRKLFFDVNLGARLPWAFIAPSVVPPDESPGRFFKIDYCLDKGGAH